MAYSNSKINAALEARKKRIASTSSEKETSDDKILQESHDSKIQAALDARSERIKSTWPDLFKSLENTLTQYGTKINEGAYLNRNEILEYKNAVQEYLTIGGKLVSPADPQRFTKINQQLADSAAFVYDTYSQFDNEEDWKWAYARSTPEKRLALYENLQKQRDNLPAEMQKELATVTSPTDIFAIMQKYEAKDQELAAEMENYKRGNYNESGLFYGSKTVDDYYPITQRADFSITSANRDYKNPTREEIDKGLAVMQSLLGD